MESEGREAFGIEVGGKQGRKTLHRSQGVQG